MKLMSLAVCALLMHTAHAQNNRVEVPRPGIAFQPAVQFKNLDTAAYAQWADGAETRVQAKDIKAKLPQHVIWTDQTEPGYGGISFGDSRQTGARHLRIGFHTAVAIGTLLTEGGGRPSVLKPGIAYPGNLNDESQWITAQRLVNGVISGKEVLRGEYGLWVFPAGTTTRAIRFTHQPAASDESYEGWLGGALVTTERFTNRAEEAVVSAKTSNQRARLLVNGATDSWNAWATRDEKEPAPAIAPVISTENPDWILLTWKQSVELQSLLAIWAGFQTADVQVFTGPATLHPRDAGEQYWQQLASYSKVVAFNGRLWPNKLDFGKKVTTTGIRIKLTSAITNGGNMQPKAQAGKRVWLGELMALQSLGSAPLTARIATPQVREEHPPIAVPFTLKEPGFVTLVIEDKNGIRVRNLLAETWFEAGKNTAWWDGLDDLGRDVAAARHGVYKIPAKPVIPGTYQVRGLVRGKLDASYEFSVYTEGSTPWSTDDHLGAWLANHTPPQAAVFLPPNQSPTGEPAVYLGCFVTEGPDGLAWVDLDGNKKGGKKWIGGAWTAAPYIARDAGDKAAKDVYAYVGAVWETEKNSGEAELRLTALTAKADKPVLLHRLGKLGAIGPQTGTLPPQVEKGDEIGGLAVHNGIAVVSLTVKNQLLLVDVLTGKILGTEALQHPRGLAFDATGQLLAISGTRVIRFKNITTTPLSAATDLITNGLEAPVAITLDAAGQIYISDGGASHQVKVFTATGKPVRSIGQPGKPAAGPYNELHMNNPAGIAIDSRQQLWVTEQDYLPKRVSVWSLDGKLVKAFYGPGKYGGGGYLDPEDKTKFYYAEETRGVMEFKLNWESGTSKLTQVLYRKEEAAMPLAFRSAAPENIIHYKGKRYFTNCYNSSPTSGHNTAFLFVERNGLITPIAAMGSADAWNLLKQDQFKARWPEGVDLNAKGPKASALFIWTDRNADAQVQPEELFFSKGAASGITVMNDLSFCLVHNGNALQFPPLAFTSAGVPDYSFAKARTWATGVMPPASSGGNQLFVASDSVMIATVGIEPFHKYSISGIKNGKPAWSYPNLWPGLHASHEAPLPGFPGQLIGPTRALGGLIDLKTGAGPLLAVNSNHGMVYFFTADGLLAATLFEPMRSGKRWRMPIAQRGMSLDGITLGEENFWPTITQTKEGEVFMVDGARSSLVRVNGLKSIQRLPVSSLQVTNETLEQCQAWQIKAEALRQQSHGRDVLQVRMRNAPLTIDGKLDDWKDAEWVDIDKSGVRANFNSVSKPYDVTAAVAVDGDKLYAAYHTGDAELLKNTGEMPVAPFKTGGALDLMIGTDASAKTDRQAPVAGDLRLLVTLVKNKPHAVLYRAVVADAKAGSKVPFASPWRTIYFDEVADVSKHISFAAGNNGDYEWSVPLEVLQLKPAAGKQLKGDIGILRGDGTQTIARVYWTNKATGIVSDVPAEAALTPALWGNLEFKN